ncbi:class I SAM-dependent methyltransferase [Candidatus Woesearchaeota archaeon]|nr:class I SAM-dependent methyltransferase [Candidatus Woesearchaeota archaeon]
METTIKWRGRILIKAIKRFSLQDKKVLDIGCGNGVITDQLQKYFNLKITGLDILNYLTKKIDFQLMKEEDKIPYKDNKFDLGIFTDALHHMPYKIQVKLIKEALRVSKEVLIFEVAPTFKGKLIDFLINQIHNANMPILLTHRNKQDWMKVFAKNNIKAEFYPVKTPFIYPFIHYLFHLRKE